MPDDLDATIRAALADGRPYVLLLLWAGPNRDQEGTELDALQWAHLRHLFTLRATHGLLLNGPVVDGGDLVGIGIFDDTDVDAVRELAEADPGVRSGRMRVDVRPFFGLPGDSI
jgi:uncharacterized protein YciI